jgi:hypothetical protein
VYPTLENFKNSLTMLNIRLKNPYRSDEPPLSDTENELNKPEDMDKYIFKNTEGEVLLDVYEYDKLKLLAPKGKLLISYYFHYS